MNKVAFTVVAQSGPGVLHQLSGVIAAREGDITSVEIVGTVDGSSRIYFEVDVPQEPDVLFGELRALPIVRAVDRVNTFLQIYGKRIIIVGGGAQVGQVAIGAISEADRHNLRGEHISVDTIPLVGEQNIAEAVRACARLPRAKAVVLAGSAPEAADLVVTDPVQAGVMTVMAVADTAKFTVDRLKRRVF
jgi:energy-converting hydrogenase B subunit Q